MIGTVIAAFYCVAALAGIGFQYSAYQAMPQRVPESVSLEGVPSEWRTSRDRILRAAITLDLFMCLLFIVQVTSSSWNRAFSVWVTALLFAEVTWLFGWFLRDHAALANGGRSQKATITIIGASILLATMAFGEWERYFK